MIRSRATRNTIRGILLAQPYNQCSARNVIRAVRPRRALPFRKPSSSSDARTNSSRGRLFFLPAIGGLKDQRWAQSKQSTVVSLTSYRWWRCDRRTNRDGLSPDPPTGETLGGGSGGWCAAQSETTCAQATQSRTRVGRIQYRSTASKHWDQLLDKPPDPKLNARCHSVQAVTNPVGA